MHHVHAFFFAHLPARTQEPVKAQAIRVFIPGDVELRWMADVLQPTMKATGSPRWAQP
jgi:hypothetical protein